MGFFGAIRRLFTGKKTPVQPSANGRRIAGSYDSAKVTDANTNHWANADALSADGANSVNVRYTLRNRSRYEAANNGYCKGLLRTRRNDVVGTGPRLQVTMPGTFPDPDFGTTMNVPADATRQVERRFKAWMESANINDKLRILEESGERDGECFALQFTNLGLTDDVKLDIRLIEPDQVTTPDLLWNDPLAIDGIRFDESGNPTEYHILKRHPGDPVWINPWDYDRIAAAWVIHWFDPSRPNEKRGVPSTTPSLPLFAQLRRYTLATLMAAETAANIAGVMYTDQPPPSEGGDPPEFTAFDHVPIARGSLLTAPEGWRAEAFKSEQPVSTYREFKGEILTEAGRPMCAPRNVSTGSSAEYNYSSGRLDHLPYERAIKIDRDRLRQIALDRLFKAWHREARLIPGYLPAGLPPLADWDTTWHWDGFESIDPVKDATANEIKIRTGQTTLFDVNAEDGKDGEELLRSKARQISLARQLEKENGLMPGTLYPLAVAEQIAAPLPSPEGVDAQPANAG